MKELLALRHAKSSWKHAELEDHDRPLNSRGKRDAPRMGRLLRDEGMLPDAIVSSTATRARTTAVEVARACGFEGELKSTRALYLAGPDEYLEQLIELDDSLDSVMLVGHNPGIEELVEQLTGAAETMPTAALARIALNVERWIEVNPLTRGRLLGIWRPRELA